LQDNVVKINHKEENTPIVFTFSEQTVDVEGKGLGYFCGFGGDIGGKYTKVKVKEETP
jgi:hypothetical protein